MWTDIVPIPEEERTNRETSNNDTRNNLRRLEDLVGAMVYDMIELRQDYARMREELEKDRKRAQDQAMSTFTRGTSYPRPVHVSKDEIEPEGTHVEYSKAACRIKDGSRSGWVLVAKSRCPYCQKGKEPDGK